MIHFDRMTLKLLRYIKRNSVSGVEWSLISHNFGSQYGSTFLLCELTVSGYIATYDRNGHAVSFDSKITHTDSDYRSFTTPKGNELLERRCFDFWKFLIPTIISLIALFISGLSLLLDLMQAKGY